MWRTRRVVAVGCAVRGVGPQPAGLAAPLTTCRADWRDEETRVKLKCREHGREIFVT